MSGVSSSAPVRAGLVVLSCLFCAHAERVRADEQRASTLATVDVTARGDFAQPMSVDVLDAITIEDANLHELDQLQDQIANLRIGTLGGRTSQSIVSLRGFTNPYGAPQSALVLNVDGIPVDDL